MTVPVQVGGVQKLARVLIDTGAEVNLVKKGFWPENCLYRPEKCLRLVTADGNRMDGGKLCTSMCMKFRQIIDGCELAEVAVLEDIFYEADISVDAIISFPMLYKNKVMVIPHRKALGFDEPCLILLKGLSNRAAKSEWGRWEGSHDGYYDESPHTFHYSSKPKSNPKRLRWLRHVQTEEVIEQEKHFLLVQKMGLRVTGMDANDPCDRLTKSEQRIIAQKLFEHRKESHVRGIIQAYSQSNEERLEKYRDKIHEDFDGKVLRDEVIPDPPVRGPYGYAKILLKDGAIPQRQKPFFMHGERNEAMKQIAADWQAKKFVERPTGPVEWVSQAFAVPKKSATFPWRGVVDMRGVNTQQRRVNYSLPNIENVLVKQGKNKIFSILDLRQAFHQQPMEPSSRPFTCTMTPIGVFQWRVNVMGLMNASTQFQQMMDDRAQPVADTTDIYIDDVLVGTNPDDGEELVDAHNRDLRKVLELLEKESLVADISKCKFFVREVEFCGHILGNGNRRRAPVKLMAIENWEPPRTITELRAFLG